MAKRTRLDRRTFLKGLGGTAVASGIFRPDPRDAAGAAPGPPSR